MQLCFIINSMKCLNVCQFDFAVNQERDIKSQLILSSVQLSHWERNWRVVLCSTSGCALHILANDVARLGLSCRIFAYCAQCTYCILQKEELGSDWRCYNYIYCM